MMVLAGNRSLAISVIAFEQQLCEYVAVCTLGWICFSASGVNPLESTTYSKQGLCN
jgi:hypothetical protein